MDCSDVGSGRILWKHGGNDNKATGGVMLRILRNGLLGVALLSGLVSVAGPASAGDYPNRPVHWLIGFVAGGPVDIRARVMAQWLSDYFGKAFILANRPR